MKTLLMSVAFGLFAGFVAQPVHAAQRTWAIDIQFYDWDKPALTLQGNADGGRLTGTFVWDTGLGDIWWNSNSDVNPIVSYNFTSTPSNPTRTSANFSGVSYSGTGADVFGVGSASYDGNSGEITFQDDAGSGYYFDLYLPNLSARAGSAVDTMPIGGLFGGDNWGIREFFDPNGLGPKFDRYATRTQTIGNEPFVTVFASLSEVPEPMSLALLGSGLIGMGVARRRRRRA